MARISLDLELAAPVITVQCEGEEDHGVVLKQLQQALEIFPNEFHPQAVNTSTYRVRVDRIMFFNWVASALTMKMIDNSRVPPHTHPGLEEGQGIYACTVCGFDMGEPS